MGFWEEVYRGRGGRAGDAGYVGVGEGVSGRVSVNVTRVDGCGLVGILLQYYKMLEKCSSG